MEKLKHLLAPGGERDDQVLYGDGSPAADAHKGQVAGPGSHFERGTGTAANTTTTTTTPGSHVKQDPAATTPLVHRGGADTATAQPQGGVADVATQPRAADDGTQPTGRVGTDNAAGHPAAAVDAYDSTQPRHVAGSAASGKQPVRDDGGATSTFAAPRTTTTAATSTANDAANRAGTSDQIVSRRPDIGSHEARSRECTN